MVNKETGSLVDIRTLSDVLILMNVRGPISQ